MSILKRLDVPARFYWTACIVIVAAVAFGAWKLLPRHRTSPSQDTAAEHTEFTILIFGGSTAWGVPYGGRADFGQIVSWLLGGHIGGRPIRVVNHGAAGKRAAGALKDAKQIARGAFAPGTAVALLYLGNNEFLPFDKRHDLRQHQRQLFDEATVGPLLKARILQDYAASVEQIIVTLKQARIGVIASTVVANMKDWEPNRSVLLNPDNAAVVKELLTEGDGHLAAGNAGSALPAYRKILDVEPTFALACKKVGDCYRELDRFAEARTYYQKAVDHDGNLYRETSEQTSLLRDICARHQVPVVDAVNILARASPDGLIGFELMWDNCHPTLEGYARIAGGFCEKMEEMFNVRRKRADIDVAALEHALAIDDAFKCEVVAGRGQYCYVASTLIWNPEARLARGGQYLEQALSLAPHDANLMSSLAVLTALQGNTEISLSYWRNAYRIDPQATALRAKHPYVRQVMQRNGIENLQSLLK